MIRCLYGLLAAALLGAVPALAQPVIPRADAPAPPRYVVYRAATPIQLDGRLDEAAWRQAPWTEDFVDIEGVVRPHPRFRTRARMLWDDENFYVAAEMEEPHVWATLTERDAVIFHDNDFELFIDPTGDTHAYYELEVNALGTVWDLLLVRPYRDGGPPIDAWDIAGLRVGIHVDGTLNDPTDTDSGWTVEIAMPWRVLREAAPGRRPPNPGDQWRVNFSRVQWHADIVEGRYVKRTDPATGTPLPEDNWVWSPQGAVNMHMPERWGYVQFSALRAGSATEPFAEDPNEKVKEALRQLYYRQRRFRDEHGRYASSLEELGGSDIAVEGLHFLPSLHTTPSLYEIAAPGFLGRTVRIRQDGRAWVE